MVKIALTIISSNRCHPWSPHVMGPGERRSDGARGCDRFYRRRVTVPIPPLPPYRPIAGRRSKPWWLPWRTCHPRFHLLLLRYGSSSNDGVKVISHLTYCYVDNYTKWSFIFFYFFLTPSITSSEPLIADNFLHSIIPVGYPSDFSLDLGNIFSK